jgi:Redoxin
MNKGLHFLFFVLALVFFSCRDNNANGKHKQKIQFEGKAVLEFKYEVSKDSLSFAFEYLRFFPCEPIESQTYYFAGNGAAYFDLNIQCPQKITLNIGTKNPVVFISPGDTLSVVFNEKDSISIIFEGKGAAIADYYSKKEKYFDGRDFLLAKAMAAHQAPSLREYSNTMDSITQLEIDFLFQYQKQHPLPKYFAEHEKNELEYFSAGSKLSALILRSELLGLKDSVPENYFKFIDKLSFNNPAACFSLYYCIYLDDLIKYKYRFKIGASSQKPSESFHDFYIHQAQTKLDPYLADILLARMVDIFISVGRLEMIDYDGILSNIQDTNIQNYLEKRKAENQIFLIGQKAPGFHLEDTEGNFRSLNEFKGKCIVLDFWSTACLPCIKKFPSENKTYPNATSDSICFIKACLESSKESWLNTFHKNPSNGINLFANGNWGKILKKSYQITSFPRYVLINKEGIIVKSYYAPKWEKEKD